MPDNLKELFKKRYAYHIEQVSKKYLDKINPDQTADVYKTAQEILEIVYQDKAALTAEFGKICCISAGIVLEGKLNLFSFDGKDEKAILNWLSERKPIKEFVALKNDYDFVSFNEPILDFSFIAKRYLLNGLEIPKVFNVSGMKPWNIGHLHDVSEAYRFASFGDSNTSLELLCVLMGIEVSATKSDAINPLYYGSKDHFTEAIKKHCEAKVFSLASMYCKMKNLPNINK